MAETPMSPFWWHEVAETGPDVLPDNALFPEWYKQEKSSSACVTNVEVVKRFQIYFFLWPVHAVNKRQDGTRLRETLHQEQN